MDTAGSHQQRDEGLSVGVLDLGKLLRGLSPSERITATVELARRAETGGLGRYWLAEHHVPDSAYCAPEALVPLLAARTGGLTIGHAGVILRYYSPLKIAELYLTLEAAFPGRVDLGLCRGPGVVNPTVARDLVWDNDAELQEPAFDAKLDELVEKVRRAPNGDRRRDCGPFPSMGSEPRMWMLGSSYGSAERALRNRLPLALMHFHPSMSEHGPGIARRYRQLASRSGFQPVVAIAVSVLCAASEGAARRRESELSERGKGTHQVRGTVDDCAVSLLRLAHLYEADVLVGATFSDDYADHEALIGGLSRLSQIPAALPLAT